MPVRTPKMRVRAVGAGLSPLGRRNWWTRWRQGGWGEEPTAPQGFGFKSMASEPRQLFEGISVKSRELVRSSLRRFVLGGSQGPKGRRWGGPGKVTQARSRCAWPEYSAHSLWALGVSQGQLRGERRGVGGQKGGQGLRVLASQEVWAALVGKSPKIKLELVLPGEEAHSVQMSDYKGSQTLTLGGKVRTRESEG